MKKNRGLWFILDLIFLAVFNAFFFVVGGTDHGAPVWISYGFIHFAYLMVLLTPVLARGGDSAPIYKFSLFSVSMAYFNLEFVVGVLFILIAPDNFKATLLTQLCVAGLYGIVLIVFLIANNKTADAEESRAVRIEYVKNASSELTRLMAGIDDRSVKKRVEKVHDALHSSPVRSHPDLAEFESQILASIDELGRAVGVGDGAKITELADTLIKMVNERNRRLKALN